MEAECALRADLARTAFEHGPAKHLGMSVEEASYGAVQILTHSMVQSIEENSVRKGYDPRDFALVAEGGAGPLFAAPDSARGGDSMGDRAALPRRDSSYRPARDGHGLRVRLDGLPAAFEAGCTADAACVRGAGGAGPDAARGGRLAPDQILLQRVCDCRYLGQGYELGVDVPRARSIRTGS